MFTTSLRIKKKEEEKEGERLWTRQQLHLDLLIQLSIQEATHLFLFSLI